MPFRFDPLNNIIIRLSHSWKVSVIIGEIDRHYRTFRSFQPSCLIVTVYFQSWPSTSYIEELTLSWLYFVWSLSCDWEGENSVRIIVKLFWISFHFWFNKYWPVFKHSEKSSPAYATKHFNEYLWFQSRLVIYSTGDGTLTFRVCKLKSILIKFEPIWRTPSVK